MTNVNDLVQVRIAEAARRIEAARRRRAELDAARRRGLAQRHAAKLRHLGETTSVTGSRNAPAEQPVATPSAGTCTSQPGEDADGGSFQAAHPPAAMTSPEGEQPS